MSPNAMYRNCGIHQPKVPIFLQSSRRWFIVNYSDQSEPESLNYGTVLMYSWTLVTGPPQLTKC